MRATKCIVSAGAIQSPQMLMLSGIGDPEELKKHGIEVKHALRGVGQNLQEHISAPVHFMSPLSTSYGISLAAMPRIVWNALLYATTRKGFFGNNIVESGGFVRTQPGLDRPDIQQIFVPTHQGKPGQLLAWGHGFRITSVLVRPKSKGRIGLASGKVGDPPVIDFRFFSDPGGEDMKTLIRGVKDARRILMAPAFDKYRGAAVWPAETVQTDEQIEDFIREFSSTVFHPVGTCKMGRDDMAVVDDRLARARHRRLARGRCLDHADGHHRKHQCAHNRDCGKGRGHDQGGPQRGGPNGSVAVRTGFRFAGTVKAMSASKMTISGACDREALTTSSSAQVRPAVCWQTGCRPGSVVSVLLLEAGGKDNYIWIHVPIGVRISAEQSARRLGYEIRAGTGLNNRIIGVPRGHDARRLIVDQRHGLYPRAGARLRPLAPARQCRLGVGRRAAVLQAV